MLSTCDISRHEAWTGRSAGLLDRCAYIFNKMRLQKTEFSTILIKMTSDASRSTEGATNHRRHRGREWLQLLMKPLLPVIRC